jgi:hypothetical protein
VFVEGFGGGLPAEGLAGSAVECGGDGVEVLTRVSREVGAFGEVLAQQAVGVLVGTALPGAVRVAEVDRQPGVDTQSGVWGHLGALVPGQRSAELFGKRGDRGGDRVADCFCAVPGERGAAEALAPFWNRAADSELDSLLVDLESRGLLQQEADRRWTATLAGNSAHAAASARVETIRGHLANGVTAEGYERTIDVLSRMAANLESTSSES